MANQPLEPTGCDPERMQEMEVALQLSRLFLPLALGVIPNRSEIIRGGILALGSMSDDQLAKVIAKVPRLKPGRPA